MAQFILIKEAAEQSKYTADHIRYLIRHKLVVGKKLGPIWLVDPESLHDYEQRMDKAGPSKHRPKSLEPLVDPNQQAKRIQPGAILAVFCLG